MSGQPARITTEQSGIGGYQPWLSPDAGDPRVVAGLNYDFTASGVRSGFGSRSVTQLPARKYNTTTNSFFQLDKAITLRDNYAFVTNNCELEKLFSFTYCTRKHLPQCITYPWTRAYVGETYYYAHPNYGIITYDTFTGCWCQYSPSDLDFQSDIVAVASFANRLFILSTDTVSWSEIDNGLALTPSHITGAGFQSLNLAHYATPYGIYATKFGIYIFTSAAIMHGRETDADNPFNFATHDESLPALGPQLITPYKSNILYAHANGLQIMGRAANNQFISETLSPLMSDYLRTEVFPEYATNHGSNMQLRYSQSREQIFLSVTDLCKQGFYDYTLVYNIPYEKWSSFNEQHETLLTTPCATKQQHHNFGYINHHGSLQQFTTTEDVLTQNNQEQQALNATVLIGPLTAQTEFPDQTIRITKAQVKNATGITQANTTQLALALTNQRPITNTTPCAQQTETNQTYKVYASGYVGNSDEYREATELLFSRRQHASNYYVLNFTATRTNLQITANEVGDYFEIASITLQGRVAGRL